MHDALTLFAPVHSHGSVSFSVPLYLVINITKSWPYVPLVLKIDPGGCGTDSSLKR